MDLDIMASVQEQIIGNCLCVLGDAMAMPIGSMVEKFRGELEAEIEAARERAGAGRAGGRDPARSRRRARRPAAGPLTAQTMPRPAAEDHPADDRRPRGASAPEGAMLVDAAKQGDVEIPYFCYEPKLGNPVGACRMCLVEIEGIPKLQTSCSTPGQGRDGRPHPDRARPPRPERGRRVPARQPPARLPGVRQGRRVPAPGHHVRLGPRPQSRFIEPKRHFVKPLSLSPLIAIDRERCILCYRCVRFSQEVAEDYQLIFAERGADTFVATHDGHPYVAPFSGNIIELCPVGALTSKPYRFRARPWDIEGAGGICTLCPSQCNVEFTVRDEKVMRVLAREHPERRRRLAVRQGPLRLPGDPRRRADHGAAGARRRRAARGLVGARARGRRPGSRSTAAASARWSAARRRTRRASCSSG